MNEGEVAMCQQPGPLNDVWKAVPNVEPWNPDLLGLAPGYCPLSLTRTLWSSGAAELQGDDVCPLERGK